jgi:hypothetical protein
VGHGPVPGDLAGEAVEVDPEIIKSINKVPPEGVVENVLGKLFIKVEVQICLCRYSPVVNAKTGTVIGALTGSSNGFYDHQFCSRYFSDFSRRVGISLAYLACS